MNIHPNIESFFIKSDPNSTEYVILNKEENTIFIKGSECLSPGIFDKTIASINFCLQKKVWLYL